MNPFASLGIQPALCTAVTELGFEQPTEIQEKAIPIFLAQNTDLIALAQTGTGKTAAFGLPILQNIDPNNHFTQALIISPTRELCMQIANDLAKFSKNLRSISVVAVYGGSSILKQIKDIKRSAQIIVATPGRLMDLMERKVIKLNNINTVVLDEADEMLNMGFREDMEAILAQTPEDKITGLFSATMSPDIRKIANTYLKNPAEITIGKKNAAQQNISHQYSVVQAKDKYTALKRIIDFHEDFYGIVFCTTKAETQELSDHLVRDGYSADCLHGDLAQAQRDKVMHRFRHKAIKALLATDVAARGIDVKNITHIIHYHLPDDIENYTHRSGRTARAGQKGISIALLHIREAYKLHQIEKLAGVKFEKYMIPTGEDVIHVRINNFIAFFKNQDEGENKIKFKNEWIWPLMEMEKEDLVHRLLTLEMKRFGIQYKDSPDINIDEKVREPRSFSKTSSHSDDSRGNNTRSKSRRDGGRNSSEMVRLFVNVGKKDQLKYDEVRELIFKNTKVSGRAVRDIEMKGVYSFFMTDRDSADQMCQVTSATFNGRPFRIDEASKQKEGRSEFKEGRSEFKEGKSEFKSNKRRRN
ncbi:MAG: DEAD/DEAH box helicase [Saprospiraceae bacterium]|nr:DEAD/DEAH box helicase [Candidatus Vicinibacter affinis]MBP6172052.1 DEAD/DEAH box helicase [Saprospiraceae bacterium]MBK6573221.1 DEAD/DEAH box helicase [Candidatus Vicinibacter affinis]MBK6822313.1 DEAD/DEAH box helicase [Candidatus Vicinibacter affinis]MBK7301902.1 DEAD/DEAH box helicase [Candidatus Vicinibacter affinis]